ncbi:MAG: DUF1553 domain-containing protein [Candidatus Sumerlaeota bacterium]|nr:DUF1553 domain-containing protein [Candidatus Sumerlaeota bacterium]
MAAFLAGLSGFGAEPRIARPYESDSGFVSKNPIDDYVLADLRKRKIEPANLCSDEVFLRRAYLDIIGTLPEPAEARAFFQDARPEKRAVLIDTLLKRDEFADYWSLKWCDLLRVKSEFPINLWPNAVQAYHRWIHDAVRENWPYDRFVRELLTSSGSNFRVPPVNFYRAVQGRGPSVIAEVVALTFMGIRFDKWPEARRSGMAAFFSRVAYKGTEEWKEEIVYLNPVSTGPLKAVFPDGVSAQIAPNEDPRQAFANWLIAPGNPWFARAIANRIWFWLMGRGIIHEPDDIRQDNPPANPELLAYLEKVLVNANYDTRVIYRLILNSRTYQQSSIPRSKNAEAEAQFAYYPARRLDAEVLIDALCRFGGSGEGYQSPIPEPFTFIPDSQRSIALGDGSISSPFLEMFGRPARDTGVESERSNQPTASQLMHLLNSTHVQQKIERGWRVGKLIESAKGNRLEMINLVYLFILSRYPTSEELGAVQKHFQSAGSNSKAAMDDLVWALINTKEFLYRH